MDLSVVTSTFNSGIFIKEFIERINNIINNNKLTAEIIIVDDGSTDNSLNLLVDLAKQNSNIKVIELSRNFGHQPAVSSGLFYSNGDCVVIIDADLQDPPELLVKMNIKMDIPQYDQEQEDLFTAAKILESIGNEEGLTTTEFYYKLIMSDIKEELHDRIFLAAVALETMIKLGEAEGSFETVH